MCELKHNVSFIAICENPSQCVILVLQTYGFGAPEWRNGLRYCISVLEASLQTLVRFQAVSQPAVIGSPIGRRTIGPASSGLGFGLERLSL